MDILARKINEYVLDAARKYPAIALLGPRQSGKTTAVKNLFPSHTYISLEDPDTLEFSINDPRGFLASHANGLILDEIQRAPHLFSYLQTLIDANPIKGQFILTGSHQLMLHSAITQSLAGRINLITLLPFSLEEIGTLYPQWDVDTFLYQGFYPRIYHDGLNPTEASRNYLRTYVERDVRLLINIKNLRVFERFLKLCAGRIGQILNYDSLANDVGVSAKTIKEWLSILEASFIIYILPPYFENFGKRQTKSPKLYFVDTGFAAYLLDIYQPSHISRDPLRGSLVENLVVMEIMKFYLNRGIEPSLYYFREHNGAEIDLIIKRGNQLYPFEIKAAKTFHENFLHHLKWFQALLKERVIQTHLIYDGRSMQRSNHASILNWRDLVPSLEKL